MKRIKEIPYKIIAGLLDAFLPDTKHSIQLKENDFLNERPSYKIDHIRFISALAGFIIILLGLLNLIDINLIVKLLSLI
jgi:hypothetical protein